MVSFLRPLSERMWVDTLAFVLSVILLVRGDMCHLVSLLLVFLLIGGSLFYQLFILFIYFFFSFCVYGKGGRGLGGVTYVYKEKLLV